MPGLLSMVGTPIGNLSDASPRVCATLQAADVVCCEDTRMTGKLLQLLGVEAPALLRCDAHVIERRVPELLERVYASEQLTAFSQAQGWFFQTWKTTGKISSWDARIALASFERERLSE